MDSNNSELIASLSLFRLLYNSKKDVYDILSVFINHLIVTEGKYSFDSTEITRLLNSNFGFDIPEAVVRTTLKRLSSFLVKANGIYTVSNIEEAKKNTKLNRKLRKI